jgi:hypothetical protein
METARLIDGRDLDKGSMHMARFARLFITRILHHVISEGVELKMLFLNDIGFFFRN